MEPFQNGKWLEENQVCLAMGDATALNLMFETQKDHQLFMSLWEKYLGKMTELIHYHLAPTGWTFLFKTRSALEIIRAYKIQRKKSKKAKRKHELKETNRILSEHFRIFLSQYVRRTNARNGRRGTLVMQRFQKYVLDKLADFKKVFELVTKHKRNQPQKNAKYQANIKRYDVKNEVKRESAWVSGNAFYRKVNVDRYGLKCIINPGSYLSVLRNFKNKTKITPNHPPFT